LPFACLNQEINLAQVLSFSIIKNQKLNRKMPRKSQAQWWQDNSINSQRRIVSNNRATNQLEELLLPVNNIQDDHRRKFSKKQNKLESLFERFIWNFRFSIIVPVIFSLISAIRFIIIGTIDIWSGLVLKINLQNPAKEESLKVVSYVIGGIDYYLIGIVLLIFAFGIYELFISEIDIRHQDDSSILQSHDLDELKSKLVNVIVVALIVSLFKQMLTLDIKNVSDAIYIALTILLISISQYLLNLQHLHPTKHKKTSENNHH
jgi:uncharacterized membrane protein YqhA